MHNDQMSKKTNLVILYGGRNSEHEVSLVSAASVIANVNRDIFNIIPIGIDREGNWWLNHLADVELCTVVQHKNAQMIYPSEFFAGRDNVVAFPVLHGRYGEDGTMQGLLEILNVPFVGPGTLSSAMCMEKDITKRLLIEQNLPTVPYVSFNRAVWQRNKNDIAEQVFAGLGTTVFVKPVNMGSSVGCSKVKNLIELMHAVDYAFEFDNKVIVEMAIVGREIECAVLENPEYGEPPLVSLPGELITQHEFYDYQAKYHDDSLQLIVPAEVDANLREQLQRLASEAFECLQCEGMARVDFFVDKISQTIYINELNTIPGFTHVSMYPMMWQASGLDFSDLITALVNLARLRYQRQMNLNIANG